MLKELTIQPTTIDIPRGFPETEPNPQFSQEEQKMLEQLRWKNEQLVRSLRKLSFPQDRQAAFQGIQLLQDTVSEGLTQPPTLIQAAYRPAVEEMRHGIRQAIENVVSPTRQQRLRR